MENKIGPPWANNLSDDDWQALLKDDDQAPMEEELYMP